MVKRRSESLLFHTNMERPGTWRKYKKGMCDTCMAACCTMIVEVSINDLIRIGVTEVWEVENCFKDLVRRLKKEGVIKRYNIKTEKFVLAQQKRGECLYLDNNRRCCHYDYRPDVCRNHPEIAGPSVGYCPYFPK